MYKLGVYDYAGSGPVHIASGFSALAWSLMLGRRADPKGESLHKHMVHFRPHNPFLVGLGTVFIWFGWFAFNGASTANLSIRSIYVVVNTNLAACGGGIAWVLLEYCYMKKFSIVKFCSGIISGLVGITPAAGFGELFFSPPKPMITQRNCIADDCCSTRLRRRSRRRFDLLLLLLHRKIQIPHRRRRRPRHLRHPRRGGFVGDILTGFFAASFVPALDGVSGTNYAGGWWNRNWIQMGYQLAAATTCAVWSFTISCILLFVINRIPGMHLRESEEDELKGLDFKYLSDVEFQRMSVDLSNYGIVRRR